jgi:predicted glutamine amidotransferase
MCEILAMSAAPAFIPRDYSPPFGDAAPASLTGWGLGFFRNGQALVEKSAAGGEPPYDAFRRLSRVVESPIILAHLRYLKSGQPPGALVQPLSDHFLDHDWLFTFTGESAKVGGYLSPRPLMDQECRAARVFEFIRDEITGGLEADPHQSLYQVLALAAKKLITSYPGEYIFFLANEGMLFAFLNHSQVRFGRLPAIGGEAGILTAGSGDLLKDPEQWVTFANRDPSRGQILIISGADLLYLGHL